MAYGKASPGAAKDGRCRNWCLVIYPDSAPKNWREILDDMHIQWAESPLHNLDVDPGTGEQKKPHYHLALSWDSHKSYDQVKQICDSLNAPIPQRCQSLRGAIRYMAHMDNPDKHQYNPADIKGHGGFDVGSFLAATETERKEMLVQMLDWQEENDVTEFADLVDYARHNRPDWLDILLNSSTIMLSTYFRSKRHRHEEKRLAAMEEESNKNREEFKRREAERKRLEAAKKDGV